MPAKPFLLLSLPLPLLSPLFLPADACRSFSPLPIVYLIALFPIFFRLPKHMQKMAIVLLLFALLVLPSVLPHHFSEAAPAAALITHLPGFNATFPSKHYGGYLTINEESTKNLYYYFVVSEGNPGRDPVVLWLNGGPGCSSFDGFVYEHGPFNFAAGTTPESLPQLHINSNSWSKASSIIYLDSPVGVGLSYSQNPGDYSTGDLQTASDTHAFVLKWFQQYPEFQSNPFYIAGESYAGVYVPTLVSKIVEGLEAGAKPTINLKGYMVGNGVTDPEFDGNALVPFAHGMGLISNDLFEEVNTACKDTPFSDYDTKSCNVQLSKVDTVLDGLNIYNILEPCHHSPSNMESMSNKSRLPASFKQLGFTSRPLPVRKRMFGRAWPFRAPVTKGRVPTWPELLQAKQGVPCTNDDIATAWLNDEAVRKAIHAQPANVAGSWELCTRRINFEHDAGSMISYHKNLTTRGYRALIYSGDHDMCVPYTGTQAWTRSLGYEVTDEWRSWWVNDQVAGYTQGYAHELTFLTIKGAGHTVPEYKPKESLAFYSRWLAEKAI